MTDIDHFKNRILNSLGIPFNNVETIYDLYNHTELLLNEYPNLTKQEWIDEIKVYLPVTIDPNELFENYIKPKYEHFRRREENLKEILG